MAICATASLLRYGRILPSWPSPQMPSGHTPSGTWGKGSASPRDSDSKFHAPSPNGIRGSVTHNPHKSRGEQNCAPPRNAGRNSQRRHPSNCGDLRQSPAPRPSSFPSPPQTRGGGWFAGPPSQPQAQPVSWGDNDPLPPHIDIHDRRTLLGDTRGTRMWRRTEGRSQRRVRPEFLTSPTLTHGGHH